MQDMMSSNILPLQELVKIHNNINVRPVSEDTLSTFIAAALAVNIFL